MEVMLMKKIMKKMKGKKVLSFVLAAIMLATTFNVALPMLKLDAGAADITIGGVSQTRIVSNYETIYENYATQYLNGASNPTNIVIPGLNALYTNETTDQDDPGDYVIQGMTYYPAKDWMLVTAYHNDGNASSKVFALDAATGDFVAMFDFKNTDDTVNYDHGGGIAISENNLYYACGDKDRKIAYAPLSEFDVPVGTYKTVKLVDYVELYELGESYTAYVCFDEGVLWTGNFFDLGVKVASIYPIADDYNTPANSQANSMVFGYKLKGSSSSEEWSNFKALAGSPSYSIALSNSLKDVQYAVVDNGKLYLSRSYGSGAGNSIDFGFGVCSWLTIADIDLSQPGTKDITINTASGSKTVKAYSIETFENYPMMPMSEGLCVIDGEIFITFEGASNKYLNESGTGTVLNGLNTKITNCDKPVDVIWQLDPYKLMEVEQAEPENSIYYERVYSNDEIIDGEEYIIVHESNVVDPVTQNRVLYAFNVNGNFNGYKLSKSSASELKGYDGMIGHPITDYNVADKNGKDILYLNDPERDDVENIRWTLTKLTPDGTTYTIKNTSTYFANCNNFYADGSRITMIPSNASSYIDKMNIDELVQNSGYFYIANTNNWEYMWCNDGVNENYNTAANTYYSNNAGANPIFEGVTEVAGTFHCNALNSGILNGPVDTSDDDPTISYADGAFKIYKRVKDDIASTYESRVFTDLNAELQADGTYTIDLETYAISPNHYKYVGERPTDYIFVMDTSSSMGTKDGTGLITYGGSATGETLGISSLCILDNVKAEATNKQPGVNGYSFTNPDEDIYYLHSDGNYYQLKLAINTPTLKYVIGILSSITQNYWAYYIADDGLYYVLKCEGSTSGVFPGVSYETFVYNVNNNIDYTRTTNKKDKDDRYDLTASNDPHYRFSTNTGEHTRLQSVQETANSLISAIKSENHNNRIAVIQHGGSSSGMYVNGSWGTDTSNALISDEATAKNAINSLSVGSSDSDVTGGMNYVNQLINAYKSEYDKKDGTGRNVAVVFFSDGVPASSDTVTAANNVITAAKTVKNNGAFIYSVIAGHATVSGFSPKTYMDAVSSKYQGATSMSALNGENVDGLIYSHTLASISLKNFVGFGKNMLKQTEANSAVSLANLDASAILREQLGDSFIVPVNDIGFEVNYVTGSFDAIGRFSFDEENKVPATNLTIGWDPSNPELVTISGYDYSAEYIAKGKEGRKLQIRISGVLANPDANLINASINNTATTAIYQTDSDMTSTGGNAFKALPTRYFNIPKYTYVLDYGLKMLDTDVNGTLKSVSAGLTAQRDANGNIAYKSTSENGLVSITNASQDLLYYNTPTNQADSGYVLIQRPDNSYDWFEIEVVPASNIYYEETSVNAAAGGTYVAWESPVNSTTKYQELSTENDVYGYDSAYEGSTGFSNGSYYKAVVTNEKTATKKSDTASFEFTGTGFDLISACGVNTGIQAVSVFKDGVRFKNYLIDTYISDESIATNGLIHQVPILTYRGDFGNYEVQTSAVYLSSAGGLKGAATASYSGATLAADGTKVSTGSAKASNAVIDELEALGLGDMCEDLEVVWMDEASVLNGGEGNAEAKANTIGGSAKVYLADGDSTTTTTNSLVNYIDGFRIYNPMNGGYEKYIESEQNATYYNLTEQLTMSDKNLVYVEGGTDGKTFTDFASYKKSGGPNGEVYIMPGGYITFTFKANYNGQASNIMLGMRAVNGATASAKTTIASATDTTVKSSTEMYYQVAENVPVNTTGVTVKVENTGSTVLAVNNLKLVNGTANANGNNDTGSGLPVLGGGNAVVPGVSGTVTPDINAGNAPETDVPEIDVEDNLDTETTTPETDVEEDVEEENIFGFDIPDSLVNVFSVFKKVFEIIAKIVTALGIA